MGPYIQARDPDLWSCIYDQIRAESEENKRRDERKNKSSERKETEKNVSREHNTGEFLRQSRGETLGFHFRGTGLNPGRETKIPHAMWCGQ